MSMAIIHSDIKKTRQPPKAVRSHMDTLLCDQETINQWRVPPFQRPVRVNEKVRLMAEGLKQNGAVISGVVTLGTIGADKTKYIVDGQHRMEAFRVSELKECIVDVRICNYDSMGEMAADFVHLNTALVKMRPDDILRGLEGSLPLLQFVRQQCPFISYGQIRRDGSSQATISMSLTLRCWYSSKGEVPSTSVGSRGVTGIPEEIDDMEGQRLVNFMNIARTAWGNDPEYGRLWSALNLTLCAWLYRRLVLDTDRSGPSRHVVLRTEQFKRCLMGLSASKNYLDWLPGRNLSDRDRGPAYNRIKDVFLKKLGEEGMSVKPKLPSPPWG